MTGNVTNVVIVGGGTAGWISAALLVRVLGNALNITLVESDEIGTVGVGEATIPPILVLNKALGIDEAEFLRETKATIKLGIEFENWSGTHDRYMHAFGSIGKDFPFCSFHHFWLKSVRNGRTESLWDYSLNYQAAKGNRFAPLERIAEASLPGLAYAYHFDAGLYARYLRRYSESLGVRRVEGRVRHVSVDAQTGHITGLNLAGGTAVNGDLFIDCSGFTGLLIDRQLSVGYEDWSHWLPCDRAVVVPSEPVRPVLPYTRSIAHDAGWRWRIPLQHRVGNGLVYCSTWLSEDEATGRLLDNLDGKPLDSPRCLSFRTGRRARQWSRNCVAIGLSSGFLEPLESTSIHMIQSAVVRLIKCFPHAGIRQPEIDEFNRQSRAEFEYIRDFIILHYYLHGGSDSAFWRECRQMSVPDTLQRRMHLFRETGKVFRDQDELFTEVAWQQVMIGQGLVPNDYHPLVDTMSATALDEMLGKLRRIIDGSVSKLPTHAEFLKGYCGADLA